MEVKAFKSIEQEYDRKTDRRDRTYYYDAYSRVNKSRNYNSHIAVK